MGVIRSGLLVIFSVLLLLSIILQGFFLTVYFSLDYELVKPGLYSVVSDLVEKQEIPEDFLEGQEELNSEKISNIVEENYYQDYSCDFWDCLKETGDPFSLISKNAQNYWGKQFFSFLIFFIVLTGIVFFLVEHKSNFFFLLSSLFVLASICFFKLDVFTGWVLKPFFSVGDRLGDLSFSYFLDLVSIFLVRAPLVFALLFGIGIFLFFIWVIFKIFGAGFKISKIMGYFSGLFKKNSLEKNKLKGISSKGKIKNRNSKKF